MKKIDVFNVQTALGRSISEKRKEHIDVSHEEKVVQFFHQLYNKLNTDDPIPKIDSFSPEEIKILWTFSEKLTDVKQVISKEVCKRTIKILKELQEKNDTRYLLSPKKAQYNANTEVSNPLTRAVKELQYYSFDLAVAKRIKKSLLKIEGTQIKEIHRLPIFRSNAVLLRRYLSRILQILEKEDAPKDSK